jgi:hypothetical protein
MRLLFLLDQTCFYVAINNVIGGVLIQEQKRKSDFSV